MVDRAGTQTPAGIPHVDVFHQWVDAVDLAVLAHRPDGEICYANAAAGRLIGVQPTDLAGQPLELLFGREWYLHGRSQYDGTGVGLAICRKIVERHGGVIRAQGHPGVGADFLIDLPRTAGELATAA